MLQVALHAHPRVAIPPETWLLVDAYRSREQFGDLRSRQGRERFADWLTARGKVPDLRLSPAALRALVLDAPPTLGSLLGVVLRGYAQQYGKPRWGDKRPAYYRDVAVIRRLLPDAQFVHVVRDGRDCVASLKRMRWWKHGIEETISTWAMSVDFGARWQRRLGPANWHELQYEHLVTDPATELRRLCAFLGEDYDEAMASPGDVAAVAVPKRKAAWHGRTGRPMDAARVAAYRTDLEPAELALMERVAGDRLERFGYALDGSGRAAGRGAVLEYHRLDAKRRLGLARDHARDVLRDARLRDDVAARLTSRQLALAGSR